MDRRVDQLIRSPGVVQVLSALSEGPLGFVPLCAYLPAGRGGDAESALRRLATFSMVRWHTADGSWDDPDPAAVYELTELGHVFAGLWDDLRAVLRQ